MEILLAHADADRLDHAKLRLTGELADVDIDVMDDSSPPGTRAEIQAALDAVA
jgi:hypothetical protein